MTRLITSYQDATLNNNWKTQYIKYRAGRLKHQYWLWNRKQRDSYLIDQYDRFILQNCQPGTTVFHASSGYYLREMFPEIVVSEEHPVVQTFVDDVCITTKADIGRTLPVKADNFAIVNNRGEQWFTQQERNTNIGYYTQAMNPGCRFFYSLRDTQTVGVNRLTNDLNDFWLEWAHSQQQSNQLQLVWHDIQFAKRQHRDDFSENPDTTNGNLKFAFVYKGDPWQIIQ